MNIYAQINCNTQIWDSSMTHLRYNRKTNKREKQRGFSVGYRNSASSEQRSTEKGSTQQICSPAQKRTSFSLQTCKKFYIKQSEMKIPGARTQTLHLSLTLHLDSSSTSTHFMQFGSTTIESEKEKTKIESLRDKSPAFSPAFFLVRSNLRNKEEDKID